jgi:HlyD family secretion protein
MIAADRLAWTLGAALLLLVGCDAPDDGVALVGTVERTLVEIVTPASEVIVEIAVERGQRVAPGQMLVRLDPTLAEAEVARAQARLSGTQTGVIVAQHELERAQDLRGARVASEQALERAQLERSEAYARLREAEAGVAVARKQRRDLDLTAPVAGVVDQIPFDRGERVPLGAVVAVLLQDGDPWVRVWIPEDRFVDVQPGTQAEIEIDGLDGALQGQVLDVAREPEFTPHFALTERDRAHLVYEARVEIRGAPATLRPGIPADVRLLLGAGAATTP